MIYSNFAQQKLQISFTKYLLPALIFSLLIPCKLQAASPPKVRVEGEVAQTRSVSLSIRTSLERRSRRTRLIIVRAPNGTKDYQTIARIRITRRTHINLVDKVSSGFSSVSYRSRLRGRVHSRWSKAVSVNFDTDSPSQDIPIEPSDNPSPQATIAIPILPMPAIPAGYSACPDNAKSDVFTLVNIARAANGAGQLVQHPALAVSSQTFSNKMAVNSVMTHDGWYDNIVAAGFKGHSFGQNIGYMYYFNPAEIVNAWLNSPPHRQNLLSQSYLYMGVGCVIDPRGFVWWTQDFGG